MQPFILVLLASLSEEGFADYSSMPRCFHRSDLRAKKLDFIGKRCEVSVLSPPLVPLRARSFEDGPISGEVRPRSIVKAIPAEVIAVETQGDQFRVAVRIKGAKYRGSFNTLVLGKNKPFIGSCHDGRLDLVFHQNPDLKAGEPFPVGTLQ